LTNHDSFILQGLTDIIGEEGVTAVLSRGVSDQAQPGCEQRGKLCPGQVQQALEAIYEVGGGQGLALQAGRASVNYVLKSCFEKLNILDNDFRLLPTRQRLLTGLERLAAALNETGEVNVQVSGDEKSLKWMVFRCPLCGDEDCIKSFFYFTQGLVQEFLSVITGGKYYPVRPLDQKPGLPTGGLASPVYILQIERKALEI
jgi:hypothetical protein